ncbi:hypothetical protein [Streptomyces sp. NPDC044948]|uniref:DUF7417 domain-containing protein n=1 Tax=Streptomyces sp. NPDC044948 TaxID=3157092 RepID=UPI0034002775
MKDIAVDLISFELGELDDSETLELFAYLVETGMAWNLQGAYGRAAQRLIDLGLISEAGEVTPEVLAA